MDELTVEKIDSIASLPEPVLRNLLITQCYCEISAEFSKRTGEGANWCTFATWASRQAGDTIRHEDLRRSLSNHLKNDPEIEAALLLITGLAKRSGAAQDIENIRKSAVGALLAQTAKHAGEAVSRGNKKVFEEIAREFVRFQKSCLADMVFDQSHIDAFIHPLRAGQPPAGQDYLRKGFTCYYNALFEPDINKKIQLNLLANLYIGLHEQNRLQPVIKDALSIPVDTARVKSDIFKRILSGASWWTRSQLLFQQAFGRKSLLDKAVDHLVQLIQNRLRLLLTEHLMTITLPPGNILRLGKDLTGTYPEGLKTLTSAELVNLLKEVDPTPDSVIESGATDWSNLSERMHFISDLFRCYHQSTDLFTNVFSDEHVKSMKNGRIPEGRL